MSNIEGVDVAKEDVKPFLRDTTQLDLWSPDFFEHWFAYLRFE